MEAHKFKNLTYTRLCGICYRPLADELHLPFIDESNIHEVKMGMKSDDFKFDNAVVVQGQSRLPEVIQRAAENLPDCYGHKCPSCGIYFIHDFKCWPDTKFKEVMPCQNCFGQGVAEIHRLDDISRLMEPTLNDAKYLAEQRLEHEQFLILEWSEMLDFEDRVARHIKDLRSKIEQFQNKIYATKKYLADRRKAESDKLTPEEWEQLRNNAARQKKVKEVNQDDVKVENKKNYKSMLGSLIKLVGNEEIAKKQLNEIWKSQNKEIPE